MVSYSGGIVPNLTLFRFISGLLGLNLPGNLQPSDHPSQPTFDPAIGHQVTISKGAQLLRPVLGNAHCCNIFLSFSMLYDYRILMFYARGTLKSFGNLLKSVS